MKTITEITRQKPMPPQIRLAATAECPVIQATSSIPSPHKIKYYSEYCKRHPEYKFVDIYADEGVTGTRTWKSGMTSVGCCGTAKKV